MSRLEKIGFTLFLAVCLGFIAAVFFMVGTISTHELRLNQ